jgi:putative redox protein
VIEVTATYHGGFAATVQARGHTIAVDEPEDIGGKDDGVMPTELLAASLASCFALAVGHVARKRDIELPDLKVTVTAHRAGAELRYERLTVTASGAPADLVAKAERFCWVSNTFANPPAIEYRATEDP